MEAGVDERFDWSEMSRTHLCEAALRLLAALGTEARFPADAAGIEALLSRVWVSPTGEGRLRLRHETGHGLATESVTLRPDGRLGEFETIAGFGVPEAELTEQARIDREAVERRVRDMEAQEANTSQEIDESQRRFRTGHLLGVRVAPAQEPGGPVVTFIALYETGVIVYYLVPRPSDEELETDDPWAEPLEAAMMPRIDLSDEHGTAYEAVDLDYLDPNAPVLRASQSFAPAVPATATSLAVRFERSSVEIDLGPV